MIPIFVFFSLINFEPVRDIKKNETTNSPIQTAAKRPESLLKSLLMVHYFLSITLKNILKALKDILCTSNS